MKVPYYYLLHPRPAYIIGSGTLGEKANIMAASWVSPVSEEPERVAVALDKESYTYELVKRTGEFTINVLPASFVDKVYCVGSVSGRNVDKALKCGLTLARSKKVSAPIVKEAVGFLECSVYKWLELGDTELVIGNVIHAEANEGLFDRRGWNLAKVTIPLHLWGRAFALTGRVVVVKK